MQALLWLQHLQIRVHQLFSSTKSSPSVPVNVLDLPETENKDKQGSAEALPPASPALEFMSP